MSTTNNNNEITREEFLDPLFERVVWKSLNGKALATGGLGGYCYDFVNNIPFEGEFGGYKILDTRGLLDESGNSDEDYEKLIDKGIKYLDKYNKVVVCCVAGISRSNAIAVGILMKYLHLDFNEAFNMVYDKINNCLIEDSHINFLKRFR
jgi:hypothetical protein